MLSPLSTVISGAEADRRVGRPHDRHQHCAGAALLLGCFLAKGRSGSRRDSALLSQKKAALVCRETGLPLGCGLPQQRTASRGAVPTGRRSFPQDASPGLGWGLSSVHLCSLQCARGLLAGTRSQQQQLSHPGGGHGAGSDPGRRGRAARLSSVRGRVSAATQSAWSVRSANGSFPGEAVIWSLDPSVVGVEGCLFPTVDSEHSRLFRC